MTEEHYTSFLASLRLRWFKPGEITRQSRRKRAGVTNSLPPLSLVDNIVPTLWVADFARESLGAPLTITSAYRSEDYNRAVGGRDMSQHKVNTALDIIPSGGPAALDRLWALLLAMRKAKTFAGGLGIYRSSGFIHLDTRGHNATWDQ